MMTFTGWLTVRSGTEALHAPHTSTGLAAPPNRTVQALGNGILAKHGVWRAGRDGTSERLRVLAGQRSRPDS